jgi:hypothetical protein
MAGKISELEQLILEDGSLKEDSAKRMLFKSYAVMFSEDLINNLDLTSIELDEKYQTDNPVSWRKFLNHNSVKKFIDGFLNERAEKMAMKQIGEGSSKTSESLKIMERVDSRQDKEDNSNMVVVFLPQKRYKTYEEEN